MKKLAIGIALVFAVVTVIYVTKKKQDDRPLVVMTQIIDHNTLDTVRSGIVARLAEKGYTDKIQLLFDNAHGNVAVATQIGQKFASLRPRVMVALSTQSAQILQNYIHPDGPYMVFTAVTDPISAKLVKTWDQTVQGITGVSDYMAPDEQLDMIQGFLPTLHTLGLLYNPSEVNSVSFLETFEKAATARGIVCVRATLNSTAEAAAAVGSLIGKVDAVYFPNDNTTMASVGAIVNVTMPHKVPVFANDLASVEQGALAALAYNRHEMGVKTADMVIGLLDGKTPAEFPVTNDISKEVVLNEKTLKALELAAPEGMKSQVVSGKHS